MNTANENSDTALTASPRNSRSATIAYPARKAANTRLISNSEATAAYASSTTTTYAIGDVAASTFHRDRVSRATSFGATTNPTPKKTTSIQPGPPTFRFAP